MMETQAQVLRLVIASPGDIDADRLSIREVVDFLNHSIAAKQGLRLDVFEWKTDVYPGFHPLDSQGQIDKSLQIENCDLLIGIFWKRFGTPVRDAASGTEHEFNRAYSSWKQNGRPQIMFYFNQEPYCPESKKETDQWGQVLEFRRNFPREGLWWAYKGRDEFKDTVLRHLTQFILDLAPKQVMQTAAPQQVTLVAAPPVPDIFIGREEGLRELKQRLGVFGHRKSGGPTPVLITLHGWPGVGKTSLAAALAHDPVVKGVFSDGVLWISLGEKPSILSALAACGRALGTDDLVRAPNLLEATAMLTALLRNRRVLLIVDDVWEIEHAVPFQHARGNECALVVTTRLPIVANHLGPTPDAAYRLPALTEDSALELLHTLAPDVVSQHPLKSRELVRDLECLPLALHVAGHMLNIEGKMGWGVERMLEELRDSVNLLQEKVPTDQASLEQKTTPTVAALLQKSIERLDELTRECFAYLGAFAPKPATFDLAAMRAVWQVADPKPIVRVLVERGLLEPFGDGRFQMHAVLVAYARSLLT